MAVLNLENEAFTPEFVDWQPVNGHRFNVLIEEDEGGVFSAIVLNLPGVGSCGDTAEEAMRNVHEAIRGAMEVYQESGEPIPWKDTSTELRPGSRWIFLENV